MNYLNKFYLTVFTVLILFTGYAKCIASSMFENNYNLANTYYIEKIKSTYKNEVANAECKINEDFKQIEISGIQIILAKPVGQSKMADLQNESTYMAIYKALNCYTSLNKQLVEDIFSDIQNEDIEKIFIEKTKDSKITDTAYEASFYFVINKNSLDFIIWKHTKGQIQKTADGYIKIKATIYDPKDILKIESFFKQNAITFKVVDYKSSHYTYLIKADAKFEDLKYKLPELNIAFASDDEGFTVDIVK